MKYIIFDLEFNSSFKIDRKTKQLLKGDINPLCPQEIIEIGAVKANPDIEIEDTFQVFVKPQLYIKLNPKVKRKTQISNQDIAQGISLEDSLKALRQWIGDDEFILCSWGMDDINELKRNCKFFDISISWIKNHWDIQNKCTHYLNLPSKTQIGLKTAIETFNIEINGRFHKALNDSIYTAKILKYMMKNL